ncbi:hypothetical protein QQF64_032986 [Cirrhinus molitorella]|uniref:Transposase n=1 Tax=Cirrhinus molitorella TaxID=172907 RepID=A0ABR3MSM3_9TELE
MRFVRNIMSTAGTITDGISIDMSKRLTREERIEIVLISSERSNRVIAADFNATLRDHPSPMLQLANCLLSFVKLLLQHLNEDDPDRRTEFAEWAKQKLEQDPQFKQKILFSDEANFYVNGEVNKQNHRYWSDTNPHWIDPSKTVGTKKVMVWCGIWGTKIVGPFFINGNLKATGYLKLLHDDVFPSLCTEAGTFPEFFQQDGAPPHYGCQVRAFLDEQFPEKWIGRRGPVEWPPKSPDLTPLDLSLGSSEGNCLWCEDTRCAAPETTDTGSLCWHFSCGVAISV